MPDRRRVNFRRLAPLGQAVVVVAALVFVVVPVWLLSRDKDSPFWFLRELPRILLYVLPFTAISVFWAWRLFKKYSGK